MGENSSIEALTTVMMNNLTKPQGELDGSISMMLEVQRIIRTYFFPLTAPFGLAGNLAIFLVMLKAKNRSMSTCIYMLFICINDTAIIAIGEPYKYYMYITKSTWTTLKCKVFSFSTITITYVATWQVVMLSLDKWLAIQFPLKAHIYCTPSKAIAVNIFVYVIITA